MLRKTCLVKISAENKSVLSSLAMAGEKNFFPGPSDPLFFEGN